MVLEKKSLLLVTSAYYVASKYWKKKNNYSVLETTGTALVSNSLVIILWNIVLFETFTHALVGSSIAVWYASIVVVFDRLDARGMLHITNAATIKHYRR